MPRLSVSAATNEVTPAIAQAKSQKTTAAAKNRTESNPAPTSAPTTTTPAAAAKASTASTIAWARIAAPRALPRVSGVPSTTSAQPRSTSAARGRVARTIAPMAAMTGHRKLPM